MERPDQRYFLAELEDRPAVPLKKAELYTIAFSVGLPSAGVIGAEPFPDDVLAVAAEDVDVFDLTVQLDSDDFEIFGERTRPLRIPRTGRSLGKARFDIAPRRNGHCRLLASVHYRGNFVQQMELAIPVGGRHKVPVEVSTRGRPPDSVASLEPRSISIVLEPASTGGFSCTALGSVVGRTILPIRDTELAAAVESARAAMMSVIQSVYAGELVFQTGIDIPDEARDSALRILARAGSRLFQRLFLHPTAGADATRIGEWLRGYALDPGLRLTVQIVADRAPLPWAMLYLGDASEGAELDWNNFLGMRHIVEQLPLQASLGTRDNEIASEPNLAVSVNVNTSIDASMGITLVAEHQKYWTDTATTRTGLKLVSRLTKSEVMRALANGRTGDQVVYFYCHATAGGQDNRSPDAAAIIMGKNDPATLADLHIDAPTTVQLAGNPLVFINACESADLSPLFYDGFVPYFMAKGARGVIGTECKIPVLFAIQWADAFFEQFLDGAAVGETVLKLRRDFVREHNNPLGLIYAVHCDADTRIAPVLARVKKQ
jgi:CHAT domain